MNLPRKAIIAERREYARYFLENSIMDRNEWSIFSIDDTLNGRQFDLIIVHRHPGPEKIAYLATRLSRGGELIIL